MLLDEHSVGKNKSNPGPIKSTSKKEETDELARFLYKMYVKRKKEIVRGGLQQGEENSGPDTVSNRFM